MVSEKHVLSKGLPKGQVQFSPLSHLGQRKSVLVIATAHQVRRVRETLESRYDVQGFPDGNQAFAWLTEHARVPDLVLLDLPHMNGYEVARRLHTTFPHAVIIQCISVNGCVILAHDTFW